MIAASTPVPMYMGRTVAHGAPLGTRRWPAYPPTAPCHPSQGGCGDHHVPFAMFITPVDSQ